MIVWYEWSGRGRRSIGLGLQIQRPHLPCDGRAVAECHSSTLQQDANTEDGLIK